MVRPAVEVVTLPQLLLERSRDATAEIGFLDFEGNTVNSLSYAQLLSEAQDCARRLLSSGLQPGGANIVISSFSNHEDHIRVFWACCLAGIPICPLPPLHPDRSRQMLFLEHIWSLFDEPTLVADESSITAVKDVLPDIKVFSIADLRTTSINKEVNSSIFPARQPVPEEIVCLMLTSGSTGNSKAVVLRHSNILSAIRGKTKHHGSTSASRFLNWIAFDHVACVTEIHLHALQANASQYHVSPAAIIQKPRNLLDWCSRLGISYSFSPNFLIAQICRDVAANPFEEGTLDLSRLKAFISGGEAVPVKTAVEYADILERYGAPRDVLRAGFGMTETCAGSIYDTRPILRDPDLYSAKYLSLGKCCDGTFVRVADPETGLVCPPLQSGQLQVSGPTVFNEYLNNQQATAESFTNDGWFITGDVAQLDENGNLHLMGRDKDCININGVKHPSVDVEHYIEDAEIRDVLKSFVFVCPMRLADADTETYGVFYRHRLEVGDVLSDEAVAQVAAANRSIKNACTVFCSQAPHVILPLPSHAFVKTALGKVSRSMLAKAYLQGTYMTLEQQIAQHLATASSEPDAPRSVVEEIVFDSVAEIFDTDASLLARSQNFFDIGASSMQLMQLKHLLQERLSIPDLPTIEMLKRPEIGLLCDYVKAVLEEDSSTTRPITEYQPLVCLNPNGSKPPLFLVHPGVGEVLVFINLARVLDDDRPVYALRARGFDYGESTFSSFEEMVDSYATAIEAQYPAGPYYLSGYSFGGAVAFEIGKKFEAKGKRVQWVGILNLPPHIQFRMNELNWVEILINLCMFLSLISSRSLDTLRAELQEEFPHLIHADAEPKSSAQVIEWLFEHSDKERLAALHIKTDEFRRWARVAYDISHAGRSYIPDGAVRGALTTVFCAIPLPSMGTKEEFKRDRLSEWRHFSGEKFEMIDVDGEHYTMLSEDHVHSFADILRSALARAEGIQASPTLSDRTLVSEAAPKPKLFFDEVPTIDFSLAESDPQEYFRQLQFALEDVGFGVFVNVPGFEDAFQKEVFKLAEELYSKPQEWRNSLGTANSYSLRGYFRADDVGGEHKAYAEAFRFGAERPVPVGKDVPFWLRLHEGPNQWPPEVDLPTFRTKMETLFSRYHALNLTLNKHICQLLDIPSKVFDTYFPNDPEFNCAIWHYFALTPEMQKAGDKGDFVQGMHEHRDPSTFLTCLIQSRPGLQVQNHQGRWIDVPMVEGGVVCNIGMQLMKLTGGKLVATTHRVNTLKINEDRYTIPYVLSTTLGKQVVPLPQFTSPSVAKEHVAPNPKVQRLLAIDDPLVRSGYARLSLFPAATQKLYPQEFEEGKRLGVL